MNLLQALQGCSVLAAIVGSDVLEERKRSASESAKRPVDGECMCIHNFLPKQAILFSFWSGFVLEGFDIEHSQECLDDVISVATNLLPEEKPRFIHGLKTPSTCIVMLNVSPIVIDCLLSF